MNELDFDEPIGATHFDAVQDFEAELDSSEDHFDALQDFEGDLDSFDSSDSESNLKLADPDDSDDDNFWDATEFGTVAMGVGAGLMSYGIRSMGFLIGRTDEGGAVDAAGEAAAEGADGFFDIEAGAPATGAPPQPSAQ
jgi:hypothetical protein